MTIDHLHNLISVGERARVIVRDGWWDIAWFGTDLDLSGPATIIEGPVIGVSAHRLSIGRGETGHVHVLRRVDIESISVHP